MEIVRELLISLGLDVDQAEFVEAIGLEHALEKGAEFLLEALKELPKQLVEVTLATAEWAHELEETKTLTGQSTDSIQEFGYLAGLAGVGADEMRMSVQHLATEMQNAKQGNEEAIRSFSRLGVRVTDAHGNLRDLDSVLTDASAGLKKLKAGADRIAAARSVFGRGGARMANVLTEDLEEARKEVHEFGIALDEDAIKKSAELQTNLNRLNLVFESMKHELGAVLAEAVGPLVEGLLDWIKANRELIRTRITQFAHAVIAVGKVLVGILAAMGKTLLFVIDNWKLFAFILAGTVLPILLANIAEIASMVLWYIALGVQAAASGLAAALAWAEAAAPIVLLAALFTALLLILDDVRGFLEGEDSLIGDLGPKWTKFINDFFKPVTGEHWLTATFRQFGALIVDFSGQWDQFVKDWKYALDQIWLGIPEPIRKVLTLGGDTGAFFQGGGSSVGAAASSAAAASPSGGSTLRVDKIEVVPPAGAPPEAYGNAVSDAMEDFWNGKTREALGALGGG